MSKETPILFSTPMVKAIDTGDKNKTRRVVKGTALKWLEDFTPEYVASPENNLCTYGSVGDILWIREEHYRYGRWIKNGMTDRGRQKWKFTEVHEFTEVRFYDNPPHKIQKNSDHCLGWYKRLARFMPKSICRKVLKITAISIERAQSITEADAKAEGVLLLQPEQYKNYLEGIGKDPWNMVMYFKTAKTSFASLWILINGQESWDANPWVWVIEFKTLSTTGKPIIHQ